MPKKYVPLIIIAAVLLLVGGSVFAFIQLRGQQAAPTDTPTKKKVVAPTNVIPMAERPYLQLLPKVDGRNLVLRVISLKKPATEMEYEIEYQTGTLLQGFAGLLHLTTLPVEDTKLLGSCSAGGACTYHENIQGGNILSTFSGDGEAYALKSDWRYFDNQAKDSQFSSKDVKFQLNSTALTTQRYLIVFNTPGFPGELPSTLVSELYALAGSSPLTGQAELSIRANEEGPLKIVGWTGTAWQEFPTTTDEKVAQANVDLMELYAVVK